MIKGETSAWAEARRVLSAGLADVSPADAWAIRTRSSKHLTPAQYAAVGGLADLVALFDRNNHD